MNSGANNTENNNIKYDEGSDMQQFAKMSNPWVHGFHGLTLEEQMITLIALSKLENTPIEQRDREVVYVSTLDVYEVRRGGYPEAKNESVQRLAQRTINASRSMLKKQVIWFDDEGKEHESQWFQDIVREKGGERGAAKSIGIQFSEKAVKNTVGFTSSYTLFDLYRIGRFNNLRTVRLFQLLMSRKVFGKLLISVDDLMYALEVPKTGSFSRFSNFYQRVVLSAVHEIIKKDSDMSDLTVEKRKEGRKVVSLLFSFKPQKDFHLLDKKWLFNESQTYHNIFQPTVEAAGLKPTKDWWRDVTAEFAQFWLSEQVKKPKASMRDWILRLTKSIEKSIDERCGGGGGVVVKKTVTSQKTSIENLQERLAEAYSLMQSAKSMGLDEYEQRKEEYDQLITIYQEQQTAA